MIESNYISWLALFSLIALSIFASMGISKCLPWTSFARKWQLDIAGAILLAPFFTGITTVIVMLILPGGSRTLQATLVFAVMVAGTVTYFLKHKSHAQNIVKNGELGSLSILLLGLLIIWIILLISGSLFLPLIQNDSLEYATVGREIFYARTLEIYPLLNSDLNTSGFYGPWTHPPLYVALIYIFSILQGHVDEPGLMRIVAPWFLLAATFAIFMIGRVRSLNTGLISAILLISTPLLFLGAGSALIDALPVAASILMLLVLVNFDTKYRAQPFALGLMLGLSLWTHSQAILLIPLIIVVVFFQHGMRDWKRALRVIVLVLLASLLIGGGPYIRNFLIFGSPVSDNPLVFDLPKLDWASYFEYARGLDNWVAIIQYGFFKGWFSIEAFGMLFWFGSAGFFLFLKKSGRSAIAKFICYGINHRQSFDNYLSSSLLLTITYLGGVVLSASIGIDLLIRNERYILIIAPLLCIAGGYFIAEILKFIGFKLNQGKLIHKELARVSITLFAIFLVMQLYLVGYYFPFRNIDLHPRPSYFGAEEIDNFSQFKRALYAVPTDQVMHYISKNIPENSLVFSMRPADMYYANRKMISYLDPRFLPFYQENNPTFAVNKLRELGVNYVFLPDYSLPPAYNSSLLKILSDPSLSRIVYQVGMAQLYEIVNDQKELGGTIDITPGKQPWSRQTQLKLGGRKALEHFGFNREALMGSDSRSSLPLFHRDYSVLLESHESFMNESLESSNSPIAIEPGEYVIQARLSGEGYITLWLRLFDEKGTPIKQSTTDRASALRIGEIPLTPENHTVNFERRVEIGNSVRYFTIGVQHNGKSHVAIEKMLLQPIVNKR